MGDGFPVDESAQIFLLSYQVVNPVADFKAVTQSGVNRGLAFVHQEGALARFRLVVGLLSPLRSLGNLPGAWAGLDSQPVGNPGAMGARLVFGISPLVGRYCDGSLAIFPPAKHPAGAYPVRPADMGGAIAEPIVAADGGGLVPSKRGIHEGSG